MNKKLKCETCGKEFEQSEFDKMFPDKNPVNRFCSDDCYNLHNEFAYKGDSHQGTTFKHKQCLIEARKNQNKTD